MDGEQRRIIRALRAEQGLSRKELAEKLATDAGFSENVGVNTIFLKDISH